MRRSTAAIAIVSAALAAAGVAWLALGAGRPADRAGKAPLVPGKALPLAKAAPAPPGGLGSLPALPRGPGEGAQAPAGPATPAKAPGAPAGGAPASDPTKAPGAAPGPLGVDGGAAPGAALASNLPDAEVLARIERREPGFEVLASRIDLGKVAVAPRWEASDVWVVETYYRQMQASHEVWSGPAFWRFTVARETGFRDRPCYEVVVTRLDEEMAPTTLYVTRAGYRLAGLATTVQQQGKERAVTWAPEDRDLDAPGAAAVKAPLTIVPFDLPPLGAEARVTPPGLTPEPPLIEGAGRARLPRLEDLLGGKDALYALEYESPVDGTTVHQRWSRQDMRWPVESRTETTWSFRRKVQ